MPKGASAWLRRHLEGDRVWRLVDARDQVLGRVACQIANTLIGSHKATYLDNVFAGDPVVVINARHFVLTGRKAASKRYNHYTGHPGGLRSVPVSRVLEKRPEHPIRLAVKRMLPPNKLRRIRLENLHIYSDSEHPYEAQQPLLMPLAHSSRRLGLGGPPTSEEMAQWWLDQMCLVPDGLLEQTLQKVRNEYSHARQHAKAGGLALLLDDKNSGVGNAVGSATRADELKGYVIAACDGASALRAESNDANYPVYFPAQVMQSGLR